MRYRFDARHLYLSVQYNCTRVRSKSRQLRLGMRPASVLDAQLIIVAIEEQMEAISLFPLIVIWSPGQ